MRFVLAAVFLLIANGARANLDVILPSVAFSATAVQEMGPVRNVQIIHYSDGKLRIDGAKGFATTILDLATQTQCLLMANHTYLVLPMDDMLFRRYFAQPVAITDAKKVAREPVAGFQTTKYGFDSDGVLDESGYYWLTDTGIMIRRTYEEGVFGETRRHQDFLQDVAIGKQDDSLFMIPAGYRVVH